MPPPPFGVNKKETWSISRNREKGKKKGRVFLPLTHIRGAAAAEKRGRPADNL